jgi:hypothetical protein
MSTWLRVLVMTLDATGTVSFLELNPPSPSISDARLVIEQCAEWRDWPAQERALAAVVLVTGHRPRLIPFAGCSESAQRAWNFGRFLLGCTGTALTLPEAPAGALML